MMPSSQFHINFILKLNNTVISCLTYACLSVISDRWKYDTSQNWEYIAKNYDNFTSTLMLDETLLRLVTFCPWGTKKRGLVALLKSLKTTILVSTPKWLSMRMAKKMAKK